MSESKIEQIIFSKVQLWLVMLLMMIGALGTLVFGWVVFRTATKPQAERWVSPLALQIAQIPEHALTLMETGVEIDADGQLVQRNTQIEPFAEFSGMFREEEDFVDGGLMLVSAYNDREKISTVYLYDLATDERLWEWIPKYDQIAAKAPSIQRFIQAGQPVPGENGRALFRTQHPYLMENGDIIVTSGEGVLVRLDPFGNVVWLSDLHYHHSIHRMPDGNFIVPVIVSTKKGYRDDGYAIVSPDGKVIEARSIVDILVRNGYRGLVFGVGPWEHDLIHLNDAEPMMESDGFVQEGDIAFSIRHLSTVLLYRPSTDEIIWLETGPYFIQHDVDYLGEGKFVVFGNDYLRGPGWSLLGHSNIYHYDMTTGKFTLPYGKVFKERQLRTPTQGLQRILRNGDAFVSITDSHQLMRISPEGIRWRYSSPLFETEPGYVGALHWSRYFYRDELDLAWLDRLNEE